MSKHLSRIFVSLEKGRKRKQKIFCTFSFANVYILKCQFQVITPRRFGDGFLHNNIGGQTSSSLDDIDEFRDDLHFRRVNVENPSDDVEEEEMPPSLRRMRFWQDGKKFKYKTCLRFDQCGDIGGSLS